MKKIIIILCLLHPIIVNSQTIDWSNFSEQTMNDEIFNKMNDYINPDKIVHLHRTSIGQEKIFRFIKKNNEKVLLNDLGRKINDIIGKSDSPFVKEANMIGNIGIIDSIPCKDFKTYQINQAQRIIKQLIGISQEKAPGGSDYYIGWSYSGIGNIDSSFYWLEKAYENRNSDFSWLKVNPVFNNLKKDPRYWDLYERTGHKAYDDYIAGMKKQ